VPNKLPRKPQGQRPTSTLNNWVAGLTNTLQMPVSSVRTRQLTKKAQAELIQKFKRAKRRAIILDYDGTLVTYTNDPMASKPPKSLLGSFAKLATLPNITVAIVSSRTRANLDDWFGRSPITLVAEHAAMLRSHGHKWEKLTKKSRSWKEELLPYMERFTADTPRSALEEKEFSLAWHYRASPPYQAQKNLVILKQTLRPLLAKYDLKISSSNKIIEIKPASINKAEVMQALIKSHGFVLVIGDDSSDEEMFKAAPATSYTVKVGRGLTAAKYRIPHPVEALHLLADLAG
jgi:trehalose 6-phosphate synthase/phosphatase